MIFGFMCDGLTPHTDFSNVSLLPHYLLVDNVIVIPMQFLINIVTNKISIIDIVYYLPSQTRHHYTHVWTNVCA